MAENLENKTFNRCVRIISLMVDYGRQLTKHTYEYRLSVIGKAVHETYAENQTPSKMKKTHKLWSAHA